MKIAFIRSTIFSLLVLLSFRQNSLLACGVDRVELSAEFEISFGASTHAQEGTLTGSIASMSSSEETERGDATISFERVTVQPTEAFNIKYRDPGIVNADDNDVDTDIMLSVTVEIPACYTKISVNDVILDLTKGERSSSSGNRSVSRELPDEWAVLFTEANQSNPDLFSDEELNKVNILRISEMYPALGVPFSGGANDACLLPDLKEEGGGIECAEPRTGEPQGGGNFEGGGGSESELESYMGLGANSAGNTAGLLLWEPDSIDDATNPDSLNLLDIGGHEVTAWNGDDIEVDGVLRARRRVLDSGSELKVDFYNETGTSVIKATRIIQLSPTEVKYETSNGGVVDQDFIIEQDEMNSIYSLTNVLTQEKEVTLLHESGSLRVRTEEQYYDANGDGTYAVSELTRRERFVYEPFSQNSETNADENFRLTSSITDPDDSSAVFPGRAGGAHLVTTYIRDGDYPPFGFLLTTVQPDGGWSSVFEAGMYELPGYLGLDSDEIVAASFSGYGDVAAPSDGYIYDPSGTPPTGSVTFDDVTTSLLRSNGDSETYVGGVLTSRSRSFFEENQTLGSVPGLDKNYRVRFYGPNEGDFDASLSSATYSYPSDHGGPAATAGAKLLRGRTYAGVRPDGSQVTYSYEEGTLDETTFTFTPGAGGESFRTTVTQGTVASPEGITGVSTQSRTVSDKYGRTRVNQALVRTAESYEVLTTGISYYNGLSDELLRTERHVGAYASGSGVTTYEAEWVNHEIVRTWDEFGVESETIAEGLVTTSYTRDGAIVNVDRSVLNLGGVESSKDSSGLETTSSESYPAEGGRATTSILPNGTRSIRNTRKDGSLASTELRDSSGNLISETRYEESIQSNGDRLSLSSTTDHLSSPSVTRHSASLRPFDWRQSKSYTPTFDQAGATGNSVRMLESVTTNDVQGKSVTSRRNSVILDTNALTLGVAQALANPPADSIQQANGGSVISLSGLDMDGNGNLDTTATSLDRVNESMSDYVLEGEVWYRRARNYRWGINGKILLSELRNSLDGRESISIDPGSGATTKQTLEVFSESAPSKYKKVIVRNAAPDGEASLQIYAGYRTLLEEVQAQNNTLAAGSSDTSGLLKTIYQYDYTDNGDDDPYNDGHKRLEKITNEFGVVTHNAYYSTGLGAGQRSTVTQAQGTEDEVSTTYTYDTLGQVATVRGTASYPIDYFYNGFGQMATMTTKYGQSASSTVTKWVYDSASGLLEEKLSDAEGGNPKGPSYIYDDFGRLQIRQWARKGEGGNGITTTYAYNAASQPTDITYDFDGGVTPDVSGISYDKAGNHRSVTDASGTRTSTWSDFGQIEAESWTSGLFNGLAVDREHSGSLRDTLSASRAGTAIYRNVSYGWDSATGLLDNISQVLTATNSHRVDYQYLAGTSLVHTATHSTSTSGELSNRHETEYVFDNLGRVSQVNNGLAGTPVRNYGPIVYDDLNRRKQIPEDTGKKWSYEYNDRGAVTRGDRLFADGDYVPGHQHRYHYDDLGNRLSASIGGDQNGNDLETVSYTPNALNQYSDYENPSFQWITGEAAVAASVTVNGLPAQGFPNEPFFASKIALNNASDPEEVDVDIRAILAGAGAGGTDLIGEESGTLLAPPQNVPGVTYDADGNLTRDGLWTYTWNAENRLITMESLTTVPSNARRRLEFSYDWQGRRIRKVVRGGTSYDTILNDRRFLYDGWKELIGVVLSKELEESEGCCLSQVQSRTELAITFSFRATMPMVISQLYPN